MRLVSLRLPLGLLFVSSIPSPHHSALLPERRWTALVHADYYPELRRLLALARCSSLPAIQRSAALGGCFTARAACSHSSARSTSRLKTSHLQKPQH